MPGTPWRDVGVIDVGQSRLRGGGKHVSFGDGDVQQNEQTKAITIHPHLPKAQKMALVRIKKGVAALKGGAPRSS